MLAAETKHPEQWDALDRLRYILDNWQDIFHAPMSSSQPKGSRGSSSSHSPPPLPEMSRDRSVRRIESALTILADTEPVLVRHLKAYRCNAEWRGKDEWAEVKLPSGKRDIVERRTRERIVPTWISLLKVYRAELFLLKLLHKDVSIPGPLWKALTK